MAITVSGTTITFNDGTTQTTAATAGIPSGSVMLFVQTSAPTGWTKSTTHDNKALRVVSGTASSGGSVVFTTAFGTPSVSGSVSGTVGATTLTTAQMPSHSHAAFVRDNKTAVERVSQITANASVASGRTVAEGGGGSHTHSFSGSLSASTATINVAYVDVIIATKN